MAQVDISINGRSYSIACDDGQEEHLTELGSVVNDKITSLIDSAGQIGDTRLFLMASLLIADDLADSVRKLQETENVATKAIDLAKVVPETVLSSPNYDEETICRALETAAQRMEGIAEMLEQS
ncbi:MAG: cell division protein ZapA [Rhodospirillales bacterium]|jgi:cell division protein ZapA|nr:cell division protein ZapA [Rhodospirillales bacterium]